MMDFEALVRQAHLDANNIRCERGLEPWNFGGEYVADDRCKMCADSGFPDVLAHYKAVPKGMSHDGKGKPPLCWDHAHGKTPRFIQETQAKIPQPTEVSLPDQPSTEICGCGRPTTHRGRCSARRKQEPASQAIERARPTPVRVKRASTQMSLPEVLENLQGMLEAHQREIESDINAVKRVVFLIRGVEKSESAAEFFTKGA